ncbi:MAG: YkgJ family cysteine cluster protein [Candidatus Heimdallarchaeota archaeon]|nr:YkgJ family cysteine cluster protein [Candidatus Heimdallarchaeota archaeon]MCK5049617.1 YkgJ family cysteine cluster protein [Candidatus Heimdallarchaeota archaeon]
MVNINSNNDENLENNSGNESENDQVDQKEQEKESKGRFIYECQRCGKSCEAFPNIPVTLKDTYKWAMDGTLKKVVQYLFVKEAENGIITMFLGHEKEEENQACPMFNKEEMSCTIYHSLPIFCHSFPLAFDGEKYYLKFQECSGLGQGEMTKDTLSDYRVRAEKEFRAHQETMSALPLLQALLMRYLMKKQEEMMSNLSPEEREELSSIISKQASKDNDTELEE